MCVCVCVCVFVCKFVRLVFVEFCLFRAGYKFEFVLLINRTPKDGSPWNVDGTYIFSAHGWRGVTGNGVPRNFFRGGGVQQIQLRTEERENVDLGT